MKTGPQRDIRRRQTGKNSGIPGCTGREMADNKLLDGGKKVKAVIFDFNGTMMYDSAIHEAVWLEKLKKAGIDPGPKSEYAKHLFGCDNATILGYYFGITDPEEIEKEAYLKEAEYRRRCAADPEVYRLVDGCAEFLDALKAAGYPLTIATGSERLNVEFYFSSPNLGLDRWFDFDKVVYDDGSFPGKPAPDGYLKACARLGVDPSECMVFEDSYSGVASARAAGVRYVIALGKGVDAARFEPVGGVDAAVEDFCGYKSFPGLELDAE